MEGIYRFYEDFGRSGSISGIFVIDSDLIDLYEGRKIYFGEVLGKHSEIVVNLHKDQFELITKDPVVLRAFEEYDLETGYNPFDYIEED